MLVFTRRPNDSIMIGDGIEVRVLRVGREGVRLGIVAPPSVAVHRREVYEQICAENRTAAQTRAPARDLAERLRRVMPGGPSRPGSVDRGRAGG